jgi:Ricin-type beta-trefoil lectin domain
MIEDGIYYICANHAGLWSYLTLDVPGGRGEDHVIIQQFGWHGGPNQQWRLTKTSAAGDPCATERRRLEELRASLRALGSGPPVTAPEAVREAWRERVRAWHAQHDQEVRRLEQRLASPECQPLPDFFTIVNVHTGKALDVPNGLAIPGLPLQQFTLHRGDNQQWRFETFPAARGPELFRPEYHRIYNRSSGLALDVPNGSQVWRVQIQQWTPHNGWNQTWILQKKQ